MTEAKAKLLKQRYNAEKRFKLYGQIAKALEDNANNQQQESTQSIEQAVQALEADFGPRGGEGYQQALDKAQVVAKHLGLDVADFWTMPGFASRLASQYDTLMGSKIRGVENTSITSAQSIDEQIHDIQNNPSNPYYTAYRDGDRAAHQKVLKLFLLHQYDHMLSDQMCLDISQLYSLD